MSIDSTVRPISPVSNTFNSLIALLSLLSVNLVGGRSQSVLLQWGMSIELVTVNDQFQHANNILLVLWLLLDEVNLILNRVLREQVAEVFLCLIMQVVVDNCRALWENVHAFLLALVGGRLHHQQWGGSFKSGVIVHSGAQIVDFGDILSSGNRDSACIGKAEQGCQGK